MKILFLCFWAIDNFLWRGLGESSNNIYTNQWAVEILTGHESANQVAERNGFKNLGKIGSLDHYYLFEHNRHKKRSLFLSGEKYLLLKDDPEVLWCQQEKVKRRVKRFVNKFKFSDPLWPRMWYLNRNGENMNVMGAWMYGYTGKGTVVAILDDGIEHNHTDLIRNYDPLASYDLIDNDNDPMPSYDSPNDNNHGTRCAGEVAAVANNRKCMVGVAYEAKIGGVRILEGDGDVTDSMEATAFSFKMDYIDIYSASWGPEDNGEVVDGPDRLAKEALLHGITKGRNGKGSIYIWASGNGGSLYDSCSCDGYASSLYTFSIGGVTENGRKPWYLEECSSTLATTYSSGDVHKERKIMTIDLFNHCGEHSGTSSSAAMAAGMCALALQANPELSWRDIQYIVILTARKIPLKDAVWVKNGVGRLVSHGFGFGLMDGLAMVKLAEHWITVPEWHSCLTDYQFLDVSFTNFLEVNMSTSACWNTSHEINYLEHVEATVWLRSSQRGSIQISLTSPNGTTSILLPRREKDLHPGNFRNWTFMSIFYWGENPLGEWKLIVTNVGKVEDHEGILHGWQLKFHGTEVYPISAIEPEQTPNSSYIDEIIMETNTSSLEEISIVGPNLDSMEKNITFERDDMMQCHKECLDNRCDGPSRYNCSSCKNFVLLDGACISSCPGNSYPNLSLVCLPCPHPCQGCALEDGKIKCTGCRSTFFYSFMSNETLCVQPCEAGTYGDAKNRKCVSCMENCINCVEQNICTECIKGYELLFSECHLPCEQSEFRSKNKSCLPCHESCRTCSGPYISDCVTCTSDRVWEGNLCVLNCSQGFYFEDSNKKLPICEMCHISCHTCIGPKASDCISCISHLKFYNNTCIDKCPSTFYPSQKHLCLPCIGSCLSCMGPDESDCLECHKPWVLFEGQCMNQCPSNSYFVDVHQYTNKVINKCYRCHHTCETCTGASGMQCNSCIEGLLYAYGQCVSKCKSMEFEEQGRCFKCHRSCVTCFGPTVNQCFDCNPDMYLVHNSCLSSCPDTYYPIGFKCLKCEDGCKTCHSYMPSFCTSCINGKFLQSGKCEEYIILCDIMHFYNDSIKVCQSCPPACAECSNAENCTKCLPAHAFHPFTTSVCIPCCSEYVSSACCLCEIDSDVCHSLRKDQALTVFESKTTTAIIYVSSILMPESEIINKATSTDHGVSVTSYSKDISREFEQMTETHEYTTISMIEPVSFFSIILSTCLALLVFLAFASVVAFCLFQAKAHNKLCWSEQQYQSVPLWHIYDPKNRKVFADDGNYPPVKV